MLGHGEISGIWETSEKIIPHMNTTSRCINIRKRIISYLPNNFISTHNIDHVLNEGVLWIIRLALLMRMGPAGLESCTKKFKPLDATTITTSIYQYLPKIISKAIIQKINNNKTHNVDFIKFLTNDDLKELWNSSSTRNELKRLTQLKCLGLWSDAPVTLVFQEKPTLVHGAPIINQPLHKKTPHPPIPDEFLATMGPRVLWIIKDLGHNIIDLLEYLNSNLDFNLKRTHQINICISEYLNDHVWRDQNGQKIENAPFNFKRGSPRAKRNHRESQKQEIFEFPPRTWSDVQSMAVSLQSAHMWIALLVMAARVGELATLTRTCVEFSQDGKLYANGKTYKASSSLTGRKKKWPLPDILVDVFAQQIKLVEASERLAIKIKNTEEMAMLLGGGSHLWASLGASGSANATQNLKCYGENLKTLALRVDLTDKPGGKNLHPHRFRKTLSRLAGLAIDGSQKVLMQLLGHEDVSTTLGYMQADPAFSKEVDDITRELRIIRGETLIKDMREALLNPSHIVNGGYGGGGAPVLTDAIHNYEKDLHRSGEEWGAETARELSVLLTNNGESARLVSAHVICTKVAGEAGLCSKKKGAISPSNCQVECRSHIEDKTGRRDTERVIPILVQHAKENIAQNNWLPFQRDKKQLELELKKYEDIGEKWRANPEVKKILEVDL